MMQAHLQAQYFSAQPEFPELEFLGIEFRMVAHMHWASPYSQQHDCNQLTERSSDLVAWARASQNSPQVRTLIHRWHVLPSSIPGASVNVQNPWLQAIPEGEIGQCSV